VQGFQPLLLASDGASSRFEVFTVRNIESIPQWSKLDAGLRHGIRIAAQVFPFRVNRYVLDSLIDWQNVPDDPLFRLVFPMPEMLHPEDFRAVEDAFARGDRRELARVVGRIRQKMNPHPAGQMTDNVPRHDGKLLAGMQHKYRETVLFFPARGQTCHSYCSFCFRWPQFVGDRKLRFAARDVRDLLDYLRKHPEVSDLLITGGDPLVMQASALRAIIEPILHDRALSHLQTIRIGTKALAYWPQRFVHDPDADELLALFEAVVRSGRHLALMAHISHPRELEVPIAQQAIRRIRATGAILRSQSPVLRWINDDAGLWATMWRHQVRVGIVPYYMFVERDTGAQHYFSLPLLRCWEIYREAIRQVSGVARTVRGPSMSAHPGKVEVQGVAEVAGERVFVLRMVQARNPDWVQRPFFARFDPEARWLDELRPAFGQSRFFFEERGRI